MGCGEKLKQLKDLGKKITGLDCVGEDIDDVICNIKNNVPFTGINTDYVWDEIDNNFEKFNDLWNKWLEAGSNHNTIVVFDECIIVNATNNNDIKTLTLLVTSYDLIVQYECNSENVVTSKRYSLTNIPPDLSQERTVEITTDGQNVGIPALGTTKYDTLYLSSTGSFDVDSGSLFVVINPFTVDNVIGISVGYTDPTDNYIRLKGGISYTVFNDGNVLYITCYYEI